MVSFYSFSYAIFWELKELENSWAQHNVRGNLQFLEFDIFYCECNGGLHINLAIICTSKSINPILHYLYSELDCLTEDVVTLR